ncbi:Rossmann fold domain-containing protein [Tsuneonella sp. HG222]
MEVMRWEVADLAEGPLDRAARFYAHDVAGIRSSRDGHPGRDVALVFAPASHEHQAWRLAAVQELAREFAPARVNGIVGQEEEAIAATIAYLCGAPGVTGQLLAVA